LIDTIRLNFVQDLFGILGRRLVVRLIVIVFVIYAGWGAKGRSKMLFAADSEIPRSDCLENVRNGRLWNYGAELTLIASSRALESIRARTGQVIFITRSSGRFCLTSKDDKAASEVRVKS
jgi:hypothetical protein